MGFPLPEFDFTRCVGSGLCVELCPTDCLDMWNDRPRLKYPAACISCTVCELVCPTNAIHVQRHSAPMANNKVSPAS